MHSRLPVTNPPDSKIFRANWTVAGQAEFRQALRWSLPGSSGIQHFGRWEYSLRCVHAGDCVPFLVRQILAAANSARTSPPGSDVRLQKDKPQPANAPLAVQVGQTATLFWEQDGIRAVLPVTCLDRGSVGSLVRARTKNGNRILRAEVVSAGVLRAAL